MTVERWEEQYEREQCEHQARAKKAWETTYKKRKPAEKDKNDVYTEYVFDEGTVTTPTAIVVKTTRFRFMKDGEIYMSKLQNRRQLFLVVSGPLAGKRIADDNEDYMLFNRNGRFARSAGVPTCVLVHRASLKT